MSQKHQGHTQLAVESVKASSRDYNAKS